MQYRKCEYLNEAGDTKCGTTKDLCPKKRLQCRVSMYCYRVRKEDALIQTKGYLPVEVYELHVPKDTLIKDVI
jgi:hypothetical protein